MYLHRPSSDFKFQSIPGWYENGTEVIYTCQSKQKGDSVMNIGTHDIVLRRKIILMLTYNVCRQWTGLTHEITNMGKHNEDGNDEFKNKSGKGLLQMPKKVKTIANTTA